MALSSNKLAELMEQELKVIYPQLKGISLSEAGSEDRRMMFLAISRGLLRHLKQEEDSTVTDITLQNGVTIVTHTVPGLTLNITIEGV